MDVISYEYTKQRRDYGKHVQFSDSAVQCVSVSSQSNGSDINQQWLLPNVTTVELQCLPDISVHEVNTERYITHSKGISSVDGGWPADVKSNDPVDKQRYIRRLVLEPQYANSVMTLCKTVDNIVNDNNTIDLYQHYWPVTLPANNNNNNTADNTLLISSNNTSLASQQTQIKTIAVFRDPLSHKQRSATSSSWYPDSVDNGGAKLAVSYSSLVFQQSIQQQRNNDKTNNNTQQQQQQSTTATTATTTATATTSTGSDSSYNWDTLHPNSPDSIIQSNHPITYVQYNHRSPDHLLVGHYNGTISFYDLRKSNTALDSSVLELSHSDPVYSLAWVQSRSGNECVSLSSDGYMKWWDIRKLKAGPIDQMLLKDEQSGIVCGGISLEYKSDAGATRYLIGTEQGYAVLVDRKAKKDSDSVKSIKSIYGNSIYGGQHYGPIYHIQRNPFNMKYFITVGDWCAKLWFEDIKTPLWQTYYSQHRLTAGCWSTTRPGVFYTGSSNGQLDVWDLYTKMHQPVYTTIINTDVKITHLSMKNDGKQLSVCSGDGSVTILVLSKNLTELQMNEKLVISQLFEAESKREKNLELRNIQRKRDNKENDKYKHKNNISLDELQKQTIDIDNDIQYKEIIEEAELQFKQMLSSNDDSNNALEKSSSGDSIGINGQSKIDNFQEEKTQT